MKFREHRGGLAESMATVVELNSKQEFVDHVSKLVRGIVPEGTVSFSQYSFDSRIGWDTYLVSLDKYGVIGMIDGPPPLEWWPKPEFVFGPEVE
jgi:hypothetical protein